MLTILSYRSITTLQLLPSTSTHSNVSANKGNRARDGQQLFWTPESFCCQSWRACQWYSDNEDGWNYQVKMSCRYSAVLVVHSTTHTVRALFSPTTRSCNTICLVPFTPFRTSSLITNYVPLSRYVCMLKLPALYGVGADYQEDNLGLIQKRADIAHAAHSSWKVLAHQIWKPVRMFYEHGTGQDRLLLLCDI